MNIRIMDKEKSEQISQSSGIKSQIKGVISQHNPIEGLNKEEEKEEKVSVQSYLDASKLSQLLKNVCFPAPKSKVLQQVRLSEDFQNKENILRALHDLEERSYNNISDVTIAAGLVHK